MVTPAGNAMRTHAFRVPASWSVARAQRSAAGVDLPSYCLTLQEGREAGVALLEQIRATAESEAGHTPMYCVARPINYAKCLRVEDPALHAFETLQGGREKFVVVVDGRDRVAGIITKDELAGVLAKAIAQNPLAEARHGESEPVPAA
jgi:hypothetical protein